MNQFIGGTLGALTDAASSLSGNETSLVVIIVGTVVAIVGMVVVGFYGKKEFNRLVAELDEEKKEDAAVEVEAVGNDEEKLNQQGDQLNLERNQTD